MVPIKEGADLAYVFPTISSNEYVASGDTDSPTARPHVLASLPIKSTSSNLDEGDVVGLVPEKHALYIVPASKSISERAVLWGVISRSAHTM